MHAPDGVLARLVGGVRTFADELWGAATHGHRDEAGFVDLLSIDAIDDLLARTLRRPSARMVHDGQPVPDRLYCAPVRLGGTMVDDVLSPAKVAEQLRLGSTLVLQSLQHHWPPITEFAAALTDEIGHRVQVNAYLTPPGATALSAHADEHDVFVLQVAGSKLWWIDGTGDVRLDEGDVRYIPRGLRHCARSLHDASLHLTVGVLSTTRRDVVSMLTRGVSDLEKPLPLGFHRDDASSKRAIDEVVDAARGWLAALDTSEAAESFSQGVRSAKRRSSLDHVGAAVALLEIGRDSELVWIDPRVHVESSAADDGRVRLELSGRALRIPAAMVPAVELLSATDRAVRVGDLPGLDPASQIVVARRLVTEGACELLGRGAS
jgi:mannose-6-phosphate isomerase-like protein (cupin superfamily)